jgi:hypothetical protein
MDEQLSMHMIAKSGKMLLSSWLDLSNNSFDEVRAWNVVNS